MAKKQVIIIVDVPRIDRFVYDVIWSDGRTEHYTTRLAAYRALASGLPIEDRNHLVCYAQVARMLQKDSHYTFATKARRVYQLRATEVYK